MRLESWAWDQTLQAGGWASCSFSLLTKGRRRQARVEGWDMAGQQVLPFEAGGSRAQQRCLEMPCRHLSSQLSCCSESSSVLEASSLTEGEGNESMWVRCCCRSRPALVWLPVRQGFGFSLSLPDSLSSSQVCSLGLCLQAILSLWSLCPACATTVIDTPLCTTQSLRAPVLSPEPRSLIGGAEAVGTE